MLGLLVFLGLSQLMRCDGLHDTLHLHKARTFDQHTAHVRQLRKKVIYHDPDQWKKDIETGDSDS